MIILSLIILWLAIGGIFVAIRDLRKQARATSAAARKDLIAVASLLRNEIRALRRG